jgi:hypothetical protein
MLHQGTKSIMSIVTTLATCLVVVVERLDRVDVYLLSLVAKASVTRYSHEKSMQAIAERCAPLQIHPFNMSMFA